LVPATRTFGRKTAKILPKLTQKRILPRRALPTPSKDGTVGTGENTEIIKISHGFGLTGKNGGQKKLQNLQKNLQKRLLLY